ncbi:hypothetical protein EDB85DRAFT_2279209 [Lactarius pseudohatsudake]|nr:hypothetical protein EDB85DRAFT_2279209 [Lactarius pseudohatsudake]
MENKRVWKRKSGCIGVVETVEDFTANGEETGVEEKIGLHRTTMITVVETVGDLMVRTAQPDITICERSERFSAALPSTEDQADQPLHPEAPNWLKDELQHISDLNRAHRAHSLRVAGLLLENGFRAVPARRARGERSPVTGTKHPEARRERRNG